MELQKKSNWVKNDKKRFAGSVAKGGGSGNGGNFKKNGSTNGGNGIIMSLEKLPVNIPSEKFTEYALDPIKQPDKARAFRDALGYTKANYQDLIDNINRNLDKNAMKFKGNKGYGDTYEYVMRLKGADNKEANVLTAWINDPLKAELRLSSAYVTDKKVTKDDKS